MNHAITFPHTLFHAACTTRWSGCRLGAGVLACQRRPDFFGRTKSCRAVLLPAVFLGAIDCRSFGAGEKEVGQVPACHDNYFSAGGSLPYGIGQTGR